MNGLQENIIFGMGVFLGALAASVISLVAVVIGLARVGKHGPEARLLKAERLWTFGVALVIVCFFLVAASAIGDGIELTKWTRLGICALVGAVTGIVYQPDTLSVRAQNLVNASMVVLSFTAAGIAYHVYPQGAMILAVLATFLMVLQVTWQVLYTRLVKKYEQVKAEQVQAVELPGESSAS